MGGQKLLGPPPPPSVGGTGPRRSATVTATDARTGCLIKSSLAVEILIRRAETVPRVSYGLAQDRGLLAVKDNECRGQIRRGALPRDGDVGPADLQTPAELALAPRTDLHPHI